LSALVDQGDNIHVIGGSGHETLGNQRGAAADDKLHWGCLVDPKACVQQRQSFFESVRCEEFLHGMPF
jgi:hypothetical protein